MLLPEGFYLFFDKFKLMLVVDNRKSTKTFGGLNLNIRIIQKNHCNQFECQKSTKTLLGSSILISEVYKEITR